MVEKPPPLRPAAISVVPVVPPTEVTLKSCHAMFEV